jgi:hypothetical protein
MLINFFVLNLLRAIKTASGIEIIEAIKVEVIEILSEVATTCITS